MSSWLSLSLPNPFKSDDQIPSPPPGNPTPSPDAPSPSVAGGVKEDLSVLGQTIGRQLRGVAAFLAPPPDSSSSSAAAASDSSSQALLGLKNDLVEIGGTMKSSLSLLSSNKAVSEISRFASNLLQFQSEGDEDGDDDDVDEEFEVAGVTEEVLEFVREISLRPECWTDFPLSLDIDFNMSDAQKEHASTIEHLVPSLADLSHKICNDMSEDKFWMIYFIFLLPRLHEQDAKLLSTTEIAEAREVLLQKLGNRRNEPVETSEVSQTINLSQEGVKADNGQGEGSLSLAYEVSTETPSAEPGAKSEIHPNDTKERSEKEEVDACTSSGTQKPPENEEDVSFSDLDDDDNDLSGRLSRLKPTDDERAPSLIGSSEWVRLNENSGTQGGDGQKAGQPIREKDSEGEESNDWLTVDKNDFDSLAAV
ncbi:Biorientation of chromosomes in cell division protein [Actinidia chinensis var. chinensis]|uniref:Biorientation of chromosomes in cell division protein n=1 Tax=Actinidia chinensis var. chinensis TaxID=1590841 RepID=A0A2R6QIF0_ACTCC|nr:Biorientation of chromosomes in cell division protein [Actinidia chinensis var. chinensis]